MSEVKLSELEYSGRLDSEYYQKYFLEYESLILKNNHANLNDIANFLIGPFGSAFNTDNYLENGSYRYIRGQDVKPFILKNSDNRYIPEADFNRLKKYSLKEKDILVSVVGTLGNACLVRTENLPAIFSCKSTVIRAKNISPIYILTYLNSRYGQSLLLRKERGAIQKGLNLDDLKALLIPIPDKDLEKTVDKLFLKAQNGLIQSQTLYTEAENLLLENLGLQNFQAACDSVNIKSLKESFLQTGRLDAEFYQPIYEQLENLFNHFERIKLADLVNYPISSGITPKANGDDYSDKENGIAFIRAVDLQNGEVNIDNLNYIKPSIHQTTLKRTQLKQNDVLISIAGTVGRAALFTHKIQANINQAVAILRFDENKINRLYLVAFFNSELGRQYISKYARQGLQTNLNLTEIGELSIPVPDISVQTQIADCIRQSTELREQAQALLLQAKNSVEAEIENNSINSTNCGGGVNLEDPFVLLEKSKYFARLAEWILLENLLFRQPENISVRSFSQSFGTSGRLDAEYYQPKFAHLFERLAAFKTVKLGDLVDLQKSIEPGSEAYQTEGVPFVRVADLSKFGIGQTDKYLNPKDFNDVIRPKRNTILLSKDGTVGVAYCVPEDLDVITSGAIVHLQIKPECHDEICPWYLTLVLNSMVVQLQAQRDAGGSIIQHWKPSEILAVVIPKLPKSTQQMIADRLKASFMLKTQSEKLLEQAKKLVEQHIAHF